MKKWLILRRSWGKHLPSKGGVGNWEQHNGRENAQLPPQKKKSQQKKTEKKTQKLRENLEKEKNFRPKMGKYNFETPPVSPLRLERAHHVLTCSREKFRCHDWTSIFRNCRAEILKNSDLRKKLDFDLFDSRGWTAIHAAVIMNDIDLVKVSFKILKIANLKKIQKKIL